MGSNENNQSNIRIIQLYVLIFSPLLCFFIFNSSIFTEIFLGKEFRGFSSIFNWVAAGIYCYGFANFFETRLKIINRIKTVAIILGVHTIVNLVLNILLLKHLEMEVAAIVTFACYLSITIFFISKNRMFFLNLNLLMIFQRIVLASVLFLMTCIFIKNSFLDNFTMLLLNCFLGILLYYIFLKKYLHLLKNSISEVGSYSPIRANNA